MKAASSHAQFRRECATFENILVWGIPLHDAPILLRQAALVVMPGDATISLLEPSTSSPFVRIGVEPLDQVIDALKRMGVALQRERAGVAAAEDLVRRAINGGHDLVVKAVAAEGEERRTLTEVDLALVRRCPCPVWFVECARPRTPRRIVAAIDPEADDDNATTVLADRVAVTASGLAATLDADLHVLHAWVAFGDHLLRNRMPPADLEEYVEAARARAEHSGGQILAASGLDLPPGRVHFRKGEVIQVLPQFVSDGDFDLIIIGTKGRQGWLDSIFRPHAEGALVQTRLSVLVVKVRRP
jgi:nucleotide-binding universal stress UspA family protein